MTEAPFIYITENNNDTLYVRHKALVLSGANENTLKKAATRNSRQWKVIDDPADKRRNLYGYEALASEYKAKLAAWMKQVSGCKHDENEKCQCGDPYAYMALSPIRELIRKDDKAEAFYLKYTYNGPTGQDALPAEHVALYTRQASLLNALIAARADKKGIKKRLNINIDTFYDKVIELIKADAYALPTTYRFLTQKLREYEEQEYAALISGKFGNQNRAKIRKGEVSEALLLKLLEHPNQYDDAYIAVAYNKEAQEKGFDPITPSTVTVWRTKKRAELVGAREGWEVYRKDFNRRIHRDRPSQPGYLWESDDNDLDLLFMGEEDKSPYHRFKAIFVTDSHTDLVLGRAIWEGTSMPTDLVRLAYIDAMYYVRSLTGGWYLPHEVKTDRWRVKSLTPFYESMGNYYVTPVGSKNRGWLENFFGSIDWKRCLKTGTDGSPATNYQGNNVLAKNRGFNPEAAKANQKLYPFVGEAVDQIDSFVHRLRHIDLNNTGSREQLWLEAWAALPESEKRAISDMQFLHIFGLEHSYQNSITKSGIEATIGGREVSYAVPPAYYLQNVGKKVTIKYDPYDLSRVLVTDGGSLRFVANLISNRVPGSMRDMHLAGEGGRQFLNQILEEKRADVNKVTAASDKRQQLLKESGIDAESVLRLGGSIVKELKAEAHTIYLQGSSERTRPNAIDQM